MKPVLRLFTRHGCTGFATAIVCLLLAVNSRSSRADDLPACKGVDACKCELEDGKAIDIWSVADSGKPTFVDLPGPKKTFFYSFNPCYNFQSKSCKTKGMACQHQEKGYNFTLGHVEGATWQQNAGFYSIKYTGGDGDRYTVIQIQCDKTATKPSAQALGEEKEYSKSYFFLLTTRCACPGLCSPGLSFGSVLCIIFSVVVVLYFVVGVLVMKFVRGASGLEIIPNFRLWSGLPGYIKDGFMFVVTCGKSTASEYDSFEDNS